MTQEQKQSPLSPLLSSKIVASIITTILAAGTVSAWYAYNNLIDQSVVNSTDNNPPSEVIPKVNNNNTQEEVTIYLLDDKLQVTPKTLTVEKNATPELTLTSAFRELFNNKDDSAIPPETKLNTIKIEEDGIHLDLSEEFTTGGGSVSMVGRLGQIIYTASSLDPNAPIWINVKGQPLETLGGEGIMVEQPMTRESFSKLVNIEETDN